MAKDPVCGMDVDEADPPATSQHQGSTYYFCAPGCNREFDEGPERYAAVESGPRRRAVQGQVTAITVRRDGADERPEGRRQADSR